MKTLSVPVNKARQSLGELIRGGQVVEITSRGKPVARLVPEKPKGKPWRMPKSRRKGPVGDLTQPVWDDWE